MKEIKVASVIGSSAAFTPSSGEKVYNEIISCLKQNNTTAIDFQDVELITTAFLNAAIGQLYKDYTSEFLNKRLQIVNLSADDAVRFKMVVETAKEYFKNPERFGEDVQKMFED